MVRERKERLNLGIPIKSYIRLEELAAKNNCSVAEIMRRATALVIHYDDEKKLNPGVQIALCDENNSYIKTLIVVD